MDGGWFGWGMKFLFAFISSMLLSSSIHSASEWLYYKEYPWVYDAKTEDWLYLQGGTDKKIYAYRASTKVWEEFSVLDVNNSWDEQFQTWSKNPEIYGGLAVLEQIQETKNNENIELNLYNKNISDITPLATLTFIERLSLDSNNISDISLVSQMKNLTHLEADQNKITNISPLANLTNLRNLWLSQNPISDFSPLANLKNLEGLALIGCNLSDITSLVGLTNLMNLFLQDNAITASQKSILEEALPNTTIHW